MTSDNLDQKASQRFVTVFFGSMIICLLALWVWCAYGRMWYMDSEYPLWVYKKTMLAQRCFEGKTVILGDSRPMANLIPAELNENVINLAIGGVTPIELYFSTLMMRHCANAPKNIVISIAPFHFMAAESYWGRTLAFQFLTYENANEVQSEAMSDERQSIYHRDKRGYAQDRLTNWIVAHSFPTFYYVKLIDGTIQSNRKLNEWTISDQTLTQGYVAMRSQEHVTQPSAEASLGPFVPWKIMDSYMRKTLDQLQEMGAEVFLMDMPITPLTEAHLPPRYRQDYKAYIDELTQRYPKIRFIGDILPVRKLEDFSDPFHLNTTGSKEFSQEIRGIFPI